MPGKDGSSAGWEVGQPADEGRDPGCLGPGYAPGARPVGADGHYLSAELRRRAGVKQGLQNAARTRHQDEQS